MAFDPIIAQTRFGTGLRRGVRGPRSVGAIMDIAEADAIAQTFPLHLFGGENQDLQDQRRLTQDHRRNTRDKIKTDAAQETTRQLQALNRDLRVKRIENLRNTVARGVHTDHGLRDRLVWFWADHFTAQGKSAMHETLYGDYLDVAIRPNVLGRFEILLADAITHPLMLHYLDQSASVGPNSPLGQRRPERGINENLAREVLELHTLGVGGPYTQADVQALSGALTGFTERLGHGTTFDLRQAEPGPFTILGERYAGPDRAAGDLRPLARALARHPVTARHLCTKLARHFVADVPPAALVDDLTAVYQETGGHLGRVTRAMLDHPLSWDTEVTNVKWPLEYIASGLRAMALPERLMQRMKPRRVRDLMDEPLAKMGQRWQGAAGPDGIAEADDRWITPQGLAARLEWALSAPDQLLVRFPDPRQVLDDALGNTAPESLRFAVESASLRIEGIALIFASPAFQRR